MREKIQGIRSLNGRYKADEGVKNNIGIEVAKELICTTHGHELEEVQARGNGDTRQKEQTGKNWDNYNSIIHKICFLKIVKMIKFYDTFFYQNKWKSGFAIR